MGGQRHATPCYRIFPLLNAKVRETVIGWVLSFIAGPVLLGGYGWYLCRGPRRHGVSEEEIAQLQAMADFERDEDPF
jgi:hypothetical protein